MQDKEYSKSTQRDNNSKEMLEFVLSGSVRMEVFVYLISKPSYAFKIAEDRKLNFSSVIRTLKDMKKMNIVECINPSSYRRKYYQLTSKALKIREKILACV
ncbi:MAG: hypothetical protein ACFFDC_08390 [Promethearchaeota archaeon]